MPVHALALATLLMSPNPLAPEAPSVARVGAPCHIMIDGECKVERKPAGPTAGNGGEGGNATVNYNIYFNGNPTGGNGGPGGNVGGAGPGRGPAKASPSPSAPEEARRETPSAQGGLESAVTYFTWTYNAEPEPGQRVWSRKGSRWSERYPSGKVAKVFDMVSDGSVKGCPGQLVSHSADPGFEVYIPHKGCSRMVALFRRDMGAWSTLGPMRDVR